MKAQIIRDWNAVGSLASEWNDLLHHSPADAVFLTWEWMSCWMAIHAATTEPFIVVVRNGAGTLVGLLPLYTASARLAGVVPFRVLRYMADHASGHEYPDWILRKGEEAHASTAIMRALTNSTSEWDCIWIRGVAGWTGALERMRNAIVAAGFHCHVREQAFALTELPDTIDGFMRALSSNRRKHLRSETRRILSIPTLRVRRCERREDVPEFLDALFELHSRRRAALGDPGTFRRKPAEAEFYRTFASVSFDRGWLWLFGVQDGSDFKAVQIGYVYNGVFHAVQEGFDPGYHKGVGNALRLHVVERCIETGIRHLDFLGEMSDHKRFWLAHKRTGHELFVGHRSLKNRLMFTKEVWPTGRYISWSTAASHAGAGEPIVNSLTVARVPPVRPDLLRAADLP